MRPGDPANFELVSRNALSQIEDQHHALIECAIPHLQWLSRGVAGADCVLLLLDRRGTVIRRFGRPDTSAPELAVATRLGITLDERCVGATAPSIALAEGEPAVVSGSEHFSARLSGFHCVAVPIEGWRQHVLGAVNVTCYGRPPAFDALALAVDTVRSIESSIYRPSADTWRFEFHVHPGWLGSPSSCILLVDADGTIVAANRPARAMVKAEVPQLVGGRFDEVFGVDMNRIFSQPRDSTSGLTEWRTPGGLRVFGRMELWEGPTASPPGAVVGTSPSHSAAEQPRDPTGNQPSPQRLADVEMQCIEAALARVNGNVSSAARLLGISRHTVYRRLKGAPP